MTARAVALGTRQVQGGRCCVAGQHGPARVPGTDARPLASARKGAPAGRPATLGPEHAPDPAESRSRPRHARGVAGAGSEMMRFRRRFARPSPLRPYSSADRRAERA